MASSNMYRNLDDCVRQMEAEDVTFGGLFYHNLNIQLREVSAFYGVPLSMLCGAFAALSPNVSVMDNLRSLVSCIGQINGDDEPNVGTYKRMVPPAMAILRGEADFSDVVKGPKVSAFRHNILFPATSDRVTIDGHMIGLMMGRRMTMKEAEMAKRQIEGGYEEFERVFRRWSSKYRWERTPATLQAALWHGWRRTHGMKAALLDPIPADAILPFGANIN